MTRMRTREVILAAIIALGFVIHQIGLNVSALGERLNVFLALLGLLVVAGAAGTMIYDQVVAQRIDADEHRRSCRSRPSPASSSTTPAPRRSGWRCASTSASPG